MSRELALRVTGGLEIRLWWQERPRTCLSVEIKNTCSGEGLEFAVDPACALDAFYHPYAYLSRASRARALPEAA